jgi:oligopeptide/dipeptide ABC transporter ATP-binding protein
VTPASVLLELRDLSVEYPVRVGVMQRLAGHVRAVDRANLTIHEGETLGLVGESGCGKSTLGRTIVGLTRATGGTIRFRGNDIGSLSGAERKLLRRQVQMVFQDPVGSLNPRFRIFDIVLEGRRIQGIRDTRSEQDVVRAILTRVGLDPDIADRFPHELSGGQRQRVGIARTLVLDLRLVIADEPISALDVSVQSQVLNLFAEIQRELGLAYLFIAHNLAAVAYLADRIAVMYLGRIVELGPTEAVTTRPQHPYTVALLSAVPDAVGGYRSDRVRLHGEMPSPLAPPSGCRFRTRCPIARDICASLNPALEPQGLVHQVACHFAGKLSPPSAATQPVELNAGRSAL